MDERRDTLQTQPVFVALTKPQMAFGVTYTYAAMEIMIVTILFINTQSFWVLLGIVISHVVGYVACLKEPRRFDIWFVHFRSARRLHSYRLWHCNSYRP